MFLVRRRGPLALLLALGLAALTGCGQSVQGTVTLDGNPVDGGTISFTPKQEGGPGTKAGGPIVGGKYSLNGGKAPASGSYRVDISWPKPTGQRIPTPGDPEVQMDETAESIPANYNSASTLTADVKTGSNVIDFELKSH